MKGKSNIKFLLFVFIIYVFAGLCHFAHPHRSPLTQDFCTANCTHTHRFELKTRSDGGSSLWWCLVCPCGSEETARAGGILWGWHEAGWESWEGGISARVFQRNRTNMMWTCMKRFVLRNWLPWLWGLVSLKSVGHVGRLETQGRVNIVAHIQGPSGGRIPFSSGDLRIFSL